MVRLFKIKEVRDFGSLISGAFYYVRRHFKLLGKSILYFVVPLIILTAILSAQYASGLSFQAGDNLPEFYIDVMASSFWSGIVALMAMTALATVVYNHMKLVADETISTETLQVDDIWEGVKSDFFMILILSIGVFIATMIGTIFFILPGIFIAVKLILASAVYIIEDESLGGAFSRSWNLITNYWWLTFGLSLVMYIFVALMSGAVSMPFMIIGAFTGFAGFNDPETLNSTFFGIIYGLTSSLSYIFYTVLYLSLGLHYFNLVERKEGKGLEKRINKIGHSSDEI